MYSAVPMCTNMFGLCMTLTIFHRTISIGQQNYVSKAVLKRLSITQSGQINVLNYGFCYISTIFSRIFIEKNTGQNLVSACQCMAWESTQKGERICIVSWNHTWTLQFGTQESWMQLIKEEHQQCLRRGQKCMN